MKKSVNIKNVHIMFHILLSCILQGSILRPMLFKIFINDLFYFIKNTNFANDNSNCDTIVNDLIDELLKKSETTSFTPP